MMKINVFISITDVMVVEISSGGGGGGGGG